MSAEQVSSHRSDWPRQPRHDCRTHQSGNAEARAVKCSNCNDAVLGNIFGASHADTVGEIWVMPERERGESRPNRYDKLRSSQSTKGTVYLLHLLEIKTGDASTPYSSPPPRRPLQPAPPYYRTPRYSPQPPQTRRSTRGSAKSTHPLPKPRQQRQRAPI